MAIESRRERAEFGGWLLCGFSQEDGAKAMTVVAVRAIWSISLQLYITTSRNVSSLRPPAAGALSS